MAAPVILIEASPRRAADGVAETVLLAGGGAEKPYYYNGQHWRAGVVQLPTFVTSLGFDGGEIGTGGVPQAAELQWSPTSKADLAFMAAYFWVDAEISVMIGPEGALPPVVLAGKVLDAPIEGGVLKIVLSDPAADLKKPLLTERFAGTGGLEGPAEWEGKIRKRVWGRVWNIVGEPIDKANNIFCFADPNRRIQAIDGVRDMGAPAAALTVLDWQGSVAETFAALQSAVAPQGGGVICPSIACVKWWTQPAGDLTADLKGEIGPTYVETAPQIAERIVEVLGGPAFSAGTVAAAAAARAFPVGWVAADDTTTAAAMLEDLLGNVSLLWLLDGTGQIIIREWAWGASAATAQSILVSRKKVLRPLATRKIGYRRNELPMARGDLAAIVLATDVAYLDGTPIEDLKPAEAGADVTGNNTANDTANVGGVPAATINSQLAQLETDTAQAQSDIAAAQANITSLQSDAAALQTDLSAAQADILAAQSDILAAQDDILANSDDLVTVNATLSSHGASITSLQTTASSQAGQIATLESTVSTQGSSISSQSTAITSLQGSVATLTTQITAANPNLLKNGGFENGMANWTVTNGGPFTSYLSGSWGTVARTTSDVGNGDYIVIVSDLVGVYEVTHTLSAESAFYVNGGSGVGYTEIIWYGSDGTTELRHDFGPQLIATYDFTLNGDGRRLLTWSVLPPAGVSFAKVVLTARKDSGTLTSLDWRQIKLEASTVATPYSSEAQIVQTASAVSTLNGSVATLSSTVSSQGAAITTLQSASSTQAGQIASVETTIGTQGSTISQQGTAISTLQSDYSSLSSTVSAQGATISSQAAAISTLQGSASTLETRISAGTSPNLISNGSFENGLVGWTDTSGWGSANANGWGYHAVNGGSVADGSYTYITSPRAPVFPSTSYTASADLVQFINGGTGYHYVELLWFDGGGNYISTSYGPTRVAGYDFDASGASRQTLKVSGQAPANAAFASVRTTFYKQNGVSNGMGVRQVKLERGLVASAYSTEASVGQAFAALSTLDTQYASLTSTVSTQGVTITSQQTAITTIEGNVTTLFGRAGVTVDVNGNVTGWEINNNGQSGNFIIHADYFAVVKPGGGQALQWSGGTLWTDDGAGNICEMGYLS